MSNSAKPKPGRPKKELSDEIRELLEQTDRRAMTIGDITEQVDGSRRTVQDRLDTLVEEGPIAKEKVGNAMAYWAETRADGALLMGDRFYLNFVDACVRGGGRIGWVFAILATLTGVVWWFRPLPGTAFTGLITVTVAVGILYFIASIVATKNRNLWNWDPREW